jgi:hypothetical protein
MSNNMDAIARDFAAKAGTGERMISDAGSNVITGHYLGRDTIFSYGSHFPLAVLMPSAYEEARGWWLLNGDSYSVSTSRHQNVVRNAVQGGLPVMIVSFDALVRAGIDKRTITPVEILPDRYTWEPRTRDNAPHDWERDYSSAYRGWRELPDGRWHYEASVHHLGEALFTAEFEYRDRSLEWTQENGYRAVKGTAFFLSAFDDNEPGFGLYFLAQLPDGASPSTVAEAREAMKPNLVKAADMSGRLVLRQGDVFALAHPQLQTKDLPGPSERSAYVLGVNHVATEVRKDSAGATYARGFLRHRPRESWRAPEHRQVRLGDGKTWFELVRNTVPDGRSWSRQGNVD